MFHLLFAPCGDACRRRHPVSGAASRAVAVVKRQVGLSDFRHVLRIHKRNQDAVPQAVSLEPGLETSLSRGQQPINLG
jgi:hypothetical protein